MTSTNTKAPAALAAALLFLLLATPGPVLAQVQEITVRGRVVGPDNAGLAGQRVVLHRVDESGGFTIAEAASGEDGRFELRSPPPTDTTGIYFVAARYDEELYIGPPFRPWEDAGAEQVIQVGVPAMSATAVMEQGGGAMGGMGMPGRPAQTRNWVLILVPLIGVAGVIVYALVSRNSIPQERRLLIRVAELDERMESAPAGQRESLREQRAELMAQLRAD
jgi:hypothetical protein